MRACVFLLVVSAAAMADPVPETGCQPDGESARAALNALRAAGQRCGDRLWPAAPALRASPLLAASARQYAQELAARDQLGHQDAAGNGLRARLRLAGYAMRLSAENLAGGPQSVDEALATWLSSPAHCDNLMESGFEEFGLACVSGPGRLQHYWVLQLAAPLRSSPGRSP